MQLDNTRVTIREREFLDVLDLTLRLARAEALPWLAASIIGTLPFALLNYWLLENWPTYDYGRPDAAGGVYILRLVGLTLWELPLATAAATTYLGQSMFFTKPTARRIAGDVYRAMPQLSLFQVVLRGLWILPALMADWSVVLMLLWLVPYLLYPYLNEVILLERNPLAARHGRITTWRRSQVLHGGSRASLLVRWMISVVAAGAMGVGLLFTLGYIRATVNHTWDRNFTWRSIFLPAAVWIVVWFFTVVRYLSYLDLRIRREGWEVELQVRAAAQRLVATRPALGLEAD
jgi:hypothetical protein